MTLQDYLLQETLDDLGITYTLRGNEPSEITWNSVDKRLMAEVLAWQQTYNLISHEA